MIMARIEKYYYRYFISPVVKRYALYLSPGWITFLSCMMGVFSFIGLINHNLGVAALCLIGSGYLDTLDGGDCKCTV
jgi:phosphatidylglycerophosphate synthase